MYSSYGIAFDEKGSWKFGNDFAGNVVIFGVDNSSSSHTDNRKNNWSTYGINESFFAPEKKFSINFNKVTQNFAWVCIIMAIIVTCFLMESLSLKPIMEMSTFQLNFV